MAQGLQAQFKAANDVVFQQRVSSAIAIVAIQVYGENPATTGHAARATYAVSVITEPPLSMITINGFGAAQPDKTVYGITRLLAAQGLDNDSTDAAIQAQINTDWSALAGA